MNSKRLMLSIVIKQVQWIASEFSQWHLLQNIVWESIETPFQNVSLSPLFITLLAETNFSIFFSYVENSFLPPQ